MEDSIKSVSTTAGKDKNKVEKRISIEEISNGFIITESKDYQDAKGNYKYSTTKVYSKTNPLAKVEIDLGSLMKKNMPGS